VGDCPARPRLPFELGVAVALDHDHAGPPRSSVDNPARVEGSGRPPAPRQRTSAGCSLEQQVRDLLRSVLSGVLDRSAYGTGAAPTPKKARKYDAFKADADTLSAGPRFLRPSNTRTGPRPRQSGEAPLISSSAETLPPRCFLRTSAEPNAPIGVEASQFLLAQTRVEEVRPLSEPSESRYRIAADGGQRFRSVRRTCYPKTCNATVRNRA